MPFFSAQSAKSQGKQDKNKSAGCSPSSALPVYSEHLIQYYTQPHHTQPPNEVSDAAKSEAWGYQPTPARLDSQAQRARTLLLIIADDTLRQSCIQLLDTAGYRVLAVADAAGALLLIPTTRVALILLHHTTAMGQHEWDDYIALREQAGAPVMMIGGHDSQAQAGCPEHGLGHNSAHNSPCKTGQNGDHVFPQDYLNCIDLLLRGQAKCN